MKQQKAALDAYHREGDSWAIDQTAELRAARRRAWIIASAAVGFALVEAVALVVLMPLKTVVPYTLMIDRNTGYVEALQPLDGDRIAPDKALTQSFLVQYVIARETFDANALQSNYRKASLWSADQAKSEYVASVQASNPASPLASLPRSTVIETRVKSISSLGGNSVLVRFETQRRDKSAQPLGWQPWVAVIRYRFSGDQVQRTDRYLNPLGFQVVSYRRDAEALPLPETTPSPIAGPLPAATVIRAPLVQGAPARPSVQYQGQPVERPAPRSLPDVDPVL